MSLITIPLAGCSDEADIGVDSSPITCMQAPVAEMEGFSYAAPEVVRDGSGTITSVHVWGSNNPSSQLGTYLVFGFGCGQAEVASYGVSNEQSLACPYEVSSTLSGASEVVTGGTLIVDQMSNCLAGRFRVDVDGSSGDSVGGWFSVPLL
jgi:hypothetical protein